MLSLVRGARGIHVKIMTDNTTAVACMNKQGSTKSKLRNGLTRKLWDFGIDNKLQPTAAHVPGAKTTEADDASRVFNDNPEWTLRENIFWIICDKFGEPSVDVFASRLNHKMSRYCSWEPDPRVVFIGGLMYDLEREKLFMLSHHLVSSTKSYKRFCKTMQKQSWLCPCGQLRLGSLCWKE